MSTDFKILSYTNDDQTLTVAINGKQYQYTLPQSMYMRLKYIYHNISVGKALQFVTKNGEEMKEGLQPKTGYPKVDNKATKEIYKSETDESTGDLNYNPKFRFSTNMPINSKSGNFMQAKKYNPITKKPELTKNVINNIREDEKIIGSDIERDQNRKIIRYGNLHINDRVKDPQGEIGKVTHIAPDGIIRVDYDATIQNQMGSYASHYASKCTKIENIKENIMKKLKEVDTQLKPEKETESEPDVKVDNSDVQMFQNIARDCHTISHTVESLIDDIENNNGEHYDDFTLKLKRAFEPLVVTIQRLPDTKDQLGKQEDEPDISPDQPQDNQDKLDIDKTSMPVTGGETALDQMNREKNQLPTDGKDDGEKSEEDKLKDLQKNKLKEGNFGKPLSRGIACSNCNLIVSEQEGNKGVALFNRSTNEVEKHLCKKCAIKELGEEEYNKAIQRPFDGSKDNELDERKKHVHSEKIALQSPKGRIIWVTRKNASRYVSQKGYRVASGTHKPKEKKKSNKARPKKVRKNYPKMFEEVARDYAGSGTHNIMHTDQQELMGEKDMQATRIIMRAKDNKTYAVKKHKVQDYLDKGFTLEKDAVHQRPKTLQVNETKLKRMYDEYTKIAKQEFSGLIHEVAKHIVKKEINNMKRKRSK